MKVQYDVVIAGAGPAGCACAIVLNQAGLRVCLIDQLRQNTFKVGESLPGASARLLKRLGIHQLQELLPDSDYTPCTANASAWGTDHWRYQDAIMNPEGGGWHINRVAFDQALRDRAVSEGVTFISGKLDSVSAKAFGHQIGIKANKRQTALTSHWVVDATGRKSVLCRKLGIERKRYDQQMSALCWLKPSSTDADHCSRIKSVSNGWLYTSLLPSKHRVLAFFGNPETVATFARREEDFFTAVNQTDLLKVPIDQRCIASQIQATDAGVVCLKQVVGNSLKGNSWIAIGDAALALDPLSSQGMFFGLYSGIRGAEAIANNLTCGDSNALEEYQKQLRNIVRNHLSSRQYYYASESRFIDNDFWKMRISTPVLEF